MEKIISFAPATEEEVQANTNNRGSRQFKWQFPEELFNGDWWGVEVPNNRVSSALNSFRNQSQSVYGTRASCFKGSDGKLYVRRLVDEPVEKKTR